VYRILNIDDYIYLGERRGHFECFKLNESNKYETIKHYEFSGGHIYDIAKVKHNCMLLACYIGLLLVKYDK